LGGTSPAGKERGRMTQAWDVPPTPERGDSTEEAIHTAVGAALSVWETTEEEFAEIFAMLVNAEMGDLETAPAVRAYGVVTAASVRADMLQVAAEAYFYTKPVPELESDFKELLKSYRGWAARRNDIAHGRSGQDSQTAGWYLYPGLFNTKRYPIRRPPTYLYSSVEIGRIKEGFEDLYQAALDFAARL